MSLAALGLSLQLVPDLFSIDADPKDVFHQLDATPRDLSGWRSAMVASIGDRTSAETGRAGSFARQRGRDASAGGSPGAAVEQQAGPAAVNPPLNLAVINGDFEIVRFLLADGYDVNARTDAGSYPGETPLHSVAYAGHTHIAELLLDYGADVNATDRYRYTPLRRTVEQGHLAMTELLLSKGADIVTRDINGLTLLHVVARTDHVEIARLLITGGVDVNAMDSSGFTPLDYAQGGEFLMAETLRRQGAICTIC